MKKTVSLKTIINTAILHFYTNKPQSDFNNTMNLLINDFNASCNAKKKHDILIPLQGTQAIVAWKEIYKILENICADEEVPFLNLIQYIKGKTYISECINLHLSKSCFYDKIKNIYTDIKDYLYYYNLLAPPYCTILPGYNTGMLLEVQICQLIDRDFSDSPQAIKKIIFAVDRLICKMLQSDNFKHNFYSIIRSHFSESCSNRVVSHLTELLSRTSSVISECG